MRGKASSNGARYTSPHPMFRVRHLPLHAPTIPPKASPHVRGSPMPPHMWSAAALPPAAEQAVEVGCRGRREKGGSDCGRRRERGGEVEPRSPSGWAARNRPPHPDLAPGSEAGGAAAADPVEGGEVAAGGWARRRARAGTGSRARSGSGRWGSRRRDGGRRSTGEAGVEPEERGPPLLRRRRRSTSPIRHRKKVHRSARTTDNSCQFCLGMGGFPQGSNMPFYDMLNVPMEAPAPPAGTQTFASGSTDAATDTQRRKATPKPKQPNFSVDEDKTLVSCWLNVSLDPITGAGQRKAPFWKTIVRNYNAQKGAYHPVRTLRSLEGRWSDIKKQASKFESHYNSVLNERRSGFNDMNKISAAIVLYNSLESRPMTTLHCWEMLRKEPKWVDLQLKPGQGEGGGVSGAPIDLTDSAAAEDASESENRPLKRPIGREAAKSAKRAASSASGSESSAEYTSMVSEMHIQKLSFWEKVEGVVASKMDKLVTIQEESYKHKKLMDEEILELKKRKEVRQAAKEDERIMAIDLSTCTPGQRIMYEAMQQEIVARWASKRA